MYQVRQICDEFDKSSTGGQKIKQAVKFQRQNSHLSSSLENASKKSRYKVLKDSFQYIKSQFKMVGDCKVVFI